MHTLSKNKYTDRNNKGYFCCNLEWTLVVLAHRFNRSTKGPRTIWPKLKGLIDKGFKDFSIAKKQGPRQFVLDSAESPYSCIGPWVHTLYRERGLYSLESAHTLLKKISLNFEFSTDSFKTLGALVMISYRQPCLKKRD